jgi:DNA-binding response OmpR family regulator
MKIMLVEDEPSANAKLTKALINRNYVVNVITDGQMALDFARECEYDLILLNTVLPSLDGIQLCHSLRADGYQGSIVLLTQPGTQSDRQRGLYAGADDYWVKPFRLSDFLARMQQLLDGSALRNN